MSKEYNAKYYMDNVDKYGEENKDPFLSMDNVSWPASENQVFTVFFNTTFNLASIIGLFGVLSYRAKRLTAVTFRFTSNYPGRAPSLQLFASSMGVSIGTVHVNIAMLYILYTRNILSKLNISPPPRNGRLFSQNRVSSGFYGYQLNLEGFESDNPLGVVKCPDAFPGVVVVPDDPTCDKPVVFSLFRTGKYNAMGGSTKARRNFMYIMHFFHRNRADPNEKSRYQKTLLEARRLLTSSSAPTDRNLRREVQRVVDRINSGEDDIEDEEALRVANQLLETIYANIGKPTVHLPVITHEIIYGVEELSVNTVSDKELLLHGNKIHKRIGMDVEVIDGTDATVEFEEGLKAFHTLETMQTLNKNLNTLVPDKQPPEEAATSSAFDDFDDLLSYIPLLKRTRR